MRGPWSIGFVGSFTLGVAALVLPPSGEDHHRGPRLDEAPVELGDRETCEAYSGIPGGWPKHPDAGMVFIRGGRFVPGSSHGDREETPGGSVRVDDFLIDRTEVTNAQFSAFVEDTGYLTLAERSGTAPVFHPRAEGECAMQDGEWWKSVAGANFRHPEGPDSDLVGRDNHPVVQVAYEDAVAYAQWLGHTLPTEPQWEFAARAGRDDESLHHAPRSADGRPLANTWQGDFPTVNLAEDGFLATAPVGCFPADGYGLHDTIGNVWEWTGERYRGSHRDAAIAGLMPDDPNATRVIKGGSFLCSPNFCARYRVTARHRQEADMTGVHLGFRTVRSLSSDP